MGPCSSGNPYKQDIYWKTWNHVPREILKTGPIKNITTDLKSSYKISMQMGKIRETEDI